MTYSIKEDSHVTCVEVNPRSANVDLKSSAESTKKAKKRKGTWKQEEESQPTKMTSKQVQREKNKFKILYIHCVDFCYYLIIVLYYRGEDWKEKTSHRRLELTFILLLMLKIGT